MNDHPAWSWEWIPDPPTAFGDNPVFDWIRLITVLASLALPYACLRVIREQRRRDINMSRGQTLRFVALGLGAVYISFTELAVFGTTATPRLVVGIIMLVTGWVGVRSMRREQHAQPVIRD